MKKLIKYISYYYPYEVHAIIGDKHCGRIIKYWEEENILHIQIEGGRIGLYSKRHKEFKLILKPVSVLETQIHHKKETFFPIGKLHYKEYRMRGQRGRAEYEVSKQKNANSHFITTQKSSSTSSAGVWIDLRNPYKNDFWVMRNMFEWKIDIFGLIDEGLAEDSRLAIKKQFEL